MKRKLKFSALMSFLVLALALTIGTAVAAAGPNDQAGICPNPDCTRTCPNPDCTCTGDQNHYQNGLQNQGFGQYRYGANQVD